MNSQSNLFPKITLGSLYKHQLEGFKNTQRTEDEEDEPDKPYRPDEPDESDESDNSRQNKTHFKNDEVKGDKSTNNQAANNGFSFYNRFNQKQSTDALDESDDGDDTSINDLSPPKKKSVKFNEKPKSVYF